VTGTGDPVAEIAIALLDGSVTEIPSATEIVLGESEPREHDESNGARTSTVAKMMQELDVLDRVDRSTCAIRVAPISSGTVLWAGDPPDR